MIEYTNDRYAYTIANALFSKPFRKDYLTWGEEDGNDNNNSPKPRVPKPIQKAVMSIVDTTLSGKAETQALFLKRLRKQFSSVKVKASTIFLYH